MAATVFLRVVDRGYRSPDGLPLRDLQLVRRDGPAVEGLMYRPNCTAGWADELAGWFAGLGVAVVADARPAPPPGLDGPAQPSLFPAELEG